MKKSMPLILLLVMSFTAFSQGLTPKVQVQNKDTLFCFTLSQSKVIAKHLENSRYCDSVLAQTEAQVETLNQLQAVSDSSLLMMKMKTETQQLIMANQETTITDLNVKLEQTDKKFKSERWQKRLFAVGTFLFATLAILKH